MKNLAPRFTFIEEIKPPGVFLEVQNKGLKTLHFRDNSKSNTACL
jgi:hypothetical protein